MVNIMNKFFLLKSRLNFKIPNNCYSNRRKGNILYTTLSFLFICALLYTVNLHMYQSARRNLHNIDRAYQAQTLAVLAAEYADRHAEAEAVTAAATNHAPQSVAAPAAAADEPPAAPTTDSVPGSSAMVEAAATATVVPENSLLEEAAAAPQTLRFNIGAATIDPSQRPRLVTVKLHNDPLTYRFTY